MAGVRVSLHAAAALIPDGAVVTVSASSGVACHDLRQMPAEIFQPAPMRLQLKPKTEASL